MLFPSNIWQADAFYCNHMYNLYSFSFFTYHTIILIVIFRVWIFSVMLMHHNLLNQTVGHLACLHFISIIGKCYFDLLGFQIFCVEFQAGNRLSQSQWKEKGWKNISIFFFIIQWLIYLLSVTYTAPKQSNLRPLTTIPKVFNIWRPNHTVFGKSDKYKFL